MTLAAFLLTAVAAASSPATQEAPMTALNEDQIVLSIPHGPDNPRNSGGGFAALSDGRIMFAYARYYGDSWADEASARLCARYSTDGGRTWTADDRLLLDNEGVWNVSVGSFLRLPEGRMAMFYMRKNSLADCRTYMRTSADDGQSWTEPVLCIPAPGYFVVNNDRVVRLSTGRLIVPAAYHRCKEEANADFRRTLPVTLPTDIKERNQILKEHSKRMDAAWDNRGIAMFFLSDDDGKTWREAKSWWAMPVASNSGLQEPGLVELKDGRLWAWCRTDAGCQYEMYSSDHGETWSPPAPSQFKSPLSPLSMKRISSTGGLLAVWNDHSGQLVKPRPDLNKYSWGRTPLVAAISDDDGKTWKHAKVIESDPQRGFCYVSLAFTDDAVLMSYCCGGGRDGSPLHDLMIRRIPIEWLYK